MSEGATERRFGVDDCRTVFEAAETSHLEAVLVGGQAVNFWADLYRERFPQVEAFLPFTSQDADYLTSEEEAEKLATSLHSRFRRAPRKGGMLGLCLGEIPVGDDFRVEILGKVNGVKPEAVQSTAVELTWGESKVKVIHPFLLFVGKAHNVADLDQTGRQDRKHLAIMEIVVGALFGEMAISMQPDADKALLAFLEELVKFSESLVGVKLIRQGVLIPS